MKTCYAIALEGLQSTGRALAIADLVAPGAIELVPYWVITRINVPVGYRGCGWGSKLLRQILNDADEEQVSLALEVVPSDGLGFIELVEWYRRYGFKGYYRGFYMIRRPRP